MDDKMKMLIEKLAEGPVSDIESFLGYPVSADILEDLESYLEEAYQQMPEEELNEFFSKYNI